MASDNGLEYIFIEMIGGLSNDLSDITEKLITKSISPESWYNEILSSIEESAKLACAYGRGSKTINFNDTFMAESFSVDQSVFLSDFLEAIIDDDPRYIYSNGDYNQNAIQFRVQLYTKALRLAAIQSWVDNQTKNENFNWVVTAFESCKDCPYIAEGSPYTKDTLFLLPGDGTTECKMNCKCYLENSKGQRCFLPL